MSGQDNWLKWAVELQSLAQAGLAYTENQFDKERFERIREIAAEMLTEPTGLPKEKVEDLFCGDHGYPTPKVACRAAVIEDNKILLVREKLDGCWSLPGGWVDADRSVAENIVKEVREEAGFDVTVDRLIAVQDHRKHRNTWTARCIVNFFALCTRQGGGFAANTETDAAEFFDLDHLPPLSVKRTTREQIEMCFAASRNPDWKPILE